jgi:chromosome segregation ATPase
MSKEGTPEGDGPAEVSPEDRLVELETALAERDVRILELVDAQTQYEHRIIVLEETLSQRDARIGDVEAALEQRESALREREEEFEEVGAQLAQAVAVYRTSLLAAEPEIPEEMVQGSTVEEIEESLARARQMVEQVRTQLEAQASQERVPFGAPMRSAPDLSGLSPQEKILLGLSRK